MISFENHDVKLNDGHRVLGPVIGSSGPSWHCEKFKDKNAGEIRIPRVNERSTA